MDEHGCALAEIANQVGHDDTNVTAGYVGRKTLPTRAADVMVLPTVTARLRAVSGERSRRSAFFPSPEETGCRPPAQSRSTNRPARRHRRLLNVPH
jgi:hypothetical protein